MCYCCWFFFSHDERIHFGGAIFWFRKLFSDLLAAKLKVLIAIVHIFTRVKTNPRSPKPQAHNNERVQTDALQVPLNTKDHHPTTTIEPTLKKNRPSQTHVDQQF
jgi:hypothetical protein